MSAAASPLIDWSIAQSVASSVVGGGPSVSRTEARRAVDELADAGVAAAGHVAEFTGLHPEGTPSPVRVIDRAAWVQANVTGMRAVIEPVLDSVVGEERPGRATTAVGSRVTGAQLGAILGYLSARVLGQYEVFSGSPGQLLLVAPNVVHTERTLGVDRRDFRLWVCLHEVTHRSQFTAIDWLRDHFLAEINRLVRASDPEAMRARLGAALGQLARAARGGPQAPDSLLTLMQSPEQREVMDRLTALMTLIEGHAEYVMNGVGPRVVPSVETIQARFRTRRRGANPVDRAVRRLLGIDAKMRQYAEGSTFVSTVVDRVGMDGFNLVWRSPNTLPTMAEIQDPQSWLHRIHPRADGRGGASYGSDLDGSDVDGPRPETD